MNHPVGLRPGNQDEGSIVLAPLDGLSRRKDHPRASRKA